MARLRMGDAPDDADADAEGAGTYHYYFTVESLVANNNNSNKQNSTSISVEEQEQEREQPQHYSYSYFGCIASRDIPKHTLIHTERFVLYGTEIWTAKECYDNGTHTCQQDDDDYLREYCDSVKEDDAVRQHIWNLHDQRQHDIRSGGKEEEEEEEENNNNNNNKHKRLIGIIFSNGFCNTDMGNEPCLFATGPTSRFNHSCRPNVGMDFAFRHVRLFTTRDVSKGQELYLSYNDVVYSHSAQVRRAYLLHKYRFDCQCPACRRRNTSTSTSTADDDDDEDKDDGGEDEEEDEDEKIPTMEESDARRQRMGRMAQWLATHVVEGVGASFLYDADFERKIQEVKAEEPVHKCRRRRRRRLDDDDNDGGGGGNDDNIIWRSKEDDNSSNNEDNDNDNNNKSLHLDRLLEYMEMLQIESVDHDMLQCYELAYDLAISISLGASKSLSSPPPPTSSPSPSSLPSSSSSTNVSGTHSASNTNTNTSNANARDDPIEWAKKTLQLYELRKGPNHTATQTFRLKVQSHGITTTTSTTSTSTSTTLLSPAAS